MAVARSGVEAVLLLPPVLAIASVDAMEALEEAGCTGTIPLARLASSSPPMLGASLRASPAVGMSCTGVRG